MQLHQSEDSSSNSALTNSALNNLSSSNPSAGNALAGSSFGPTPVYIDGFAVPAPLAGEQGGTLEAGPTGESLTQQNVGEAQQTAWQTRQQQTAADIAALLEEFRTEMRGQARRKYARRRLMQTTLASGGVTYLLFTAMGMLAASYPWWWAVLGVSAVVTLCCITLLALTWRLVLSPRQQQIATALARVDDVQALGPLIETMTYEGAQVPVARDTVTRLLYRVRPANAGHIDRPRRTALYGLLNDTATRDPAQTELCLAILAAIEQMGDADALPFVRSVAQRSAWSPAQRTVRDRAVECLRDWNANLAQAQSGTSLLRAATAPIDAPDVLLRPAEAVSDASSNAEGTGQA